MSKTTRKSVVFGNFRITGMCVTGDISEELACASAPGKQEVFVGVARIEYKTNVGSTGPPEYAELPKITDLGEKQDNSALLESRIKELESETETQAKKVEELTNKIKGHKSQSRQWQNKHKGLEEELAQLRNTPEVGDYLKEKEA